MAKDAQPWIPFVEHLCRELQVDPGTVDIEGLWRTTADVAREHPRPMAPVAAYILGLAAAQSPDADPAALSSRLLQAVDAD